VAATALIVLAGPVSAAAADVEVMVTELKHEGARVQCALFASADGFPNAHNAIAKTVAPVVAGQAVCRFAAVPEGSHALAAFEDRNGNGALDVNLFGVPVEGVAFSRDARGRLGPPGFEAARFVHSTAPTRLRLRTTY
jgi:uncharacterized protein (DUF2141 family)